MNDCISLLLRQSVRTGMQPAATASKYRRVVHVWPEGARQKLLLSMEDA